jgi:hypothetical protein
LVGRKTVGFNDLIGVTQDLPPIHLVIEKIKPKPLLLLGLLV